MSSKTPPVDRDPSEDEEEGPRKAAVEKIGAAISSVDHAKNESARNHGYSSYPSTKNSLGLKEFESSGSQDLPVAMNVSKKAPNEVSVAVEKLNADQMFELMKQMKVCIESNPQEARTLLIQNPELASAFLEAQAVMGIVDPGVALKILNRPPPIVAEPEAKRVDVKQILPALSMASSFAFDQDLRQLPPPDFEMQSQPLDEDMRQVSGKMEFIASGSADNLPFDPKFRPADPRSMQGLDSRANEKSYPGDMQGDPGDMQGDPGDMQGNPRMMPESHPMECSRKMATSHFAPATPCELQRGRSSKRACMNFIKSVCAKRQKPGTPKMEMPDTPPTADKQIIIERHNSRDQRRKSASKKHSRGD